MGSRAGLAEAGGVKGRHQRRALAAGGHVAAAKVAHDGDPGQLGQQRAVVQLQRVASAVETAGLVAHGLAVGADGGDGFGVEPVLLQQLLHHLGVDTHKAIGCQRGTVQFVGAALVQRQQFRAQCGWEGQMHMAA